MIKDYPDFFDHAPTITVFDPLAQFLGATSSGIIEYQYADAVAFAGHSCPTVASAFLMTRAALAALYDDATPVRGQLRVQWREPAHAGVTGVMGGVMTLLTGAAEQGGFKGIGGRFTRAQLLSYSDAIDTDIRITRTDTGASVSVAADLSRVPMAPQIQSLMPLCLSGRASDEEQTLFGQLWQARVKDLLLNHADDADVFMVNALKAA